LDAIEAMMKYLDRERVIAVGELGYNLINDLEEEVFLKQMDIAEQKDMLMTIHLPHNNKTEGMKRQSSKAGRLFLRQSSKRSSSIFILFYIFFIL
ncbi:MAG: hypothetical protein WA667_18820, partial [Candidatus Nitrosopolaris sp.]